MGSDLVKIKNIYGEKMMHLCRELFPTILEEDGKLFELLSSNFAYSKFLYDDLVKNDLIDNFKNYIYSLNTLEEELIEVPQSVEELLDSVGYTLYECKTEEDIQSFRKYYSSGEGLCTFRGNRLDKCYVFFAVKKNVDEIKRENYINPLRQDLYGTSVISIQFTRGRLNTLSIKNRYNHTVSNPDSTFSNNLENIVPGLTRSFEREYGLNINQNICGTFEIPGYVKAKDGKYYKYNYEIENIYYCSDNIIIDNFEVIRDYQEKEKYIVMDYFIIDLVNKEIFLYNNLLSDSFINRFDNIKKIEVVKSKETGNKKIIIILEDGSEINIKMDKYNRMISYRDENISNIENNFLSNNLYLEDIHIPNVLNIGNSFLFKNITLKSISLGNVLKIGYGFLSSNLFLTSVDIPKVREVGVGFLRENNNVALINMPNVVVVGSYFLSKNKYLEEINFPNLVYVGSHFLQSNKMVKIINLPSLVRVDDHFMTANDVVTEIFAPNLVEVGDSFLYRNKNLIEVSFENLEKVGRDFLHSNRCLTYANFPKLKFVGLKFLYNNENLIQLIVPELCQAKGYFLYNNNSLIELYAPKLVYADHYFLFKNKVLNTFDLSSLEECNTSFCYRNPMVRKKILNS